MYQTHLYPHHGSGHYEGSGAGGNGPGLHRPRQQGAKQGLRRTVDVSNCITLHLCNRLYWGNSCGAEWALQPHSSYMRKLPPPFAAGDNAASCLCTHWVKASVNKQRSPVNVLSWAPEGATRCITGNCSGEFTLWKDGAFNFERIMQAHDSAVRAMTWSHSGSFMVTADHGGVIKYWEQSMTNVQAFRSHGGQPVRGLSFAPRDSKFVSCSDDSTLRVWDWELYQEERALTGHGWDVKTCEWHPFKSLIASGSKDNHTKLWDPRMGTALSTLYGQNNTVMKVTWNKNGNWLLSASRDQLIKLYDIRTMKEMSTFRGHNKEVTSLAWHPQMETLFLSGGFDGTLCYWIVGNESPEAVIPQAHDDTAVWDIAWHPLGHVVATGSNDHTVKFWSRNRPGDPLGVEQEVDDEGNPIEGTAPEAGRYHATVSPSQGGPRTGPPIPGMGPRMHGGGGPSFGGRGIGGAYGGPSTFPRGRGGPPPPGYLCNRCHRPGHYINECPEPNRPPADYVCHRCGQPGHFKADCKMPMAGGPPGGPPRTALGIMSGAPRGVPMGAPPMPPGMPRGAPPGMMLPGLLPPPMVGVKRPLPG